MEHKTNTLDGTQTNLYDMDPETFRKYGYQVIDWIAEYLANIDTYPVLAQVEPGDIKGRLPAHPPEEPEPMSQILEDFAQVIIPGITHWNHPSFFAYFSISGSTPGILGELLCAALNVNGMLWKTSPAATELEELALDWLRQMLGLPAEFQGVITDTASISSLIAITAARERLNLDIRTQGMAGRPELPRLRLYISDQTHSSVEKGAIVLGIGQENVRKIPSDARFQMDPAALEQAIEADIAAGYQPFCVTATVGTTSTTSIDPVPTIAEICRRHSLWLHVDGAYGGMAAIVPEMRHVLAGCEHADSIVVNPHKWLFTPIDCSAFYVRDPALLKRAFSLVPPYLQTGEESVNNYMDWGVQLGRRFRALKLWMVLRYFGHSGLAARLREHIRLGQLIAEQVDADPDFQRMAPTPFSTVCFRACPQDLAGRLTEADPKEEQRIEAYLNDLNEAVVEAVNRSGQALFSHTLLHGRFVIRMAIGNIRTSEAHVLRAWEQMRETALHLDRERRPNL